MSDNLFTKVFDFHKILNQIAPDWYPTGSYWICAPPVYDTDIDYIIYTETLYALETSLLERGFKMTSDPEYEGGSWFLTFRKDVFNIIATDSEVFYDRFVAATMLAKSRNILDKKERVDFFKNILYGEIPGFQFKEEITHHHQVEVPDPPEFKEIV